MDRIIEPIFKNKKINETKLIKFGFIKEAEKYTYTTNFIEECMKLSIIIDSQGKIFTEMIDLSSQENYTLYLVESAIGSFVGSIREKYINLMTEIAESCFDIEIFKSEYSKKSIEYIQSKYQDELEFLWEKFPNNAIWRRKDNKKWYGILAIVSKRKLGIDSDDIIEIINLRINPEEINNIIDNNNYFQGYHMNKKHWISINLKGQVDFNEICERIDESYKLAKK